MKPHPLPRFHTAAALFASLLVTLLLAEPARAQPADAPSTRRLQLTVELQRQAALGPGTDIGRSRLAQTLAIDVLLHGDGVPMVNNPLDPDDARRQAERGQRTQQRVQAALAARGLSVTPSFDTQQAAAWQARGQQIQARCGQDRDCLMREAMALQQQMQAQMQTPVTPATARRGAAATDDGEDEVVETPYRLFQGRAGCRLDVRTRIDLRIEGHFADVQGQVPFTQTAQADQRLRDEQRCPLLQAVLDTRNGRLWTNVVNAVPPPNGVHERAERGRRTQRSEGEVALRWHEVEAWLQQRLTRLGAAGEAREQRPAADGRAEMTLTWRFGPV